MVYFSRFSSGNISCLLSGLSFLGVLLSYKFYTPSSLLACPFFLAKGPDPKELNEASNTCKVSFTLMALARSVDPFPLILFQ
jgi:hypothetical protein